MDVKVIPGEEVASAPGVQRDDWYFPSNQVQIHTMSRSVEAQRSSNV